MREQENISFILKGLEPSSELKRRVMEQAAKREAGRKTFGSEITKSDNIQIQKEQTQMNMINTNDIVNVKRRSTIITISAAACAAVVIGISAVSISGKNSDHLPTTDRDSMAANGQTVTIDDDSYSENVMTVTEQDGSWYIITDKDRIEAIDALVEKTMKSHVWDGETVPTERTLDYVVDGKKRTVEISEDMICPEEYHPDSYPHPELCHIVTVDGASYVLCEFTPDEPLSELYAATSRGGDLVLERWNDDDNTDGLFPAEYDCEEAARKLHDIIEDIRGNETPQFEKENMYVRYDCEEIPPFENVRVTCDFRLDGNYYNIELYRDSDLIVIDLYDWREGKNLDLVYKDTQNWIARIDEVFDSLKNVPEVSGTQTEGSELFGTDEEDFAAADPRDEELSADTVKLPELFDLTEEQAVAALKEAGLNCLIGYDFSGTEKGYVCSYYSVHDGDMIPKGSYVAVDISLGEYDGPRYSEEEYTFPYPKEKDTTLEVALPNGLSGSYTFNIYSADDVAYTNTIDDIRGVKSVKFDDVCGINKGRLVIYAINNDSEDKDIIRYATYEFDYESGTWSLIGKLNTDIG